MALCLRFLCLLFAVSLLISSAPVVAEEEATKQQEEEVLTLDANNFTDVVSKHAFIVVEFYAPWCGHCKRLAPEYEKAATILKDHEPPIVLAKVDANEELNKGLASQYEVRGFPTLKILRNGGEHVQEYKGPREADGIVQYLQKQVGPASVEIKTADEATKLIEENKVFTVGVFSNYESEEYGNFSKVAEALRSDYAFGHATDASVLPIKDFPLNAPAVRLFKPYDERYADTQEFDIHTLGKFVEEASMPLVTVLTKDPSSHPDVIKFFNLQESKALFFLNFTSENSEKLKTAYEESAKAFKGKGLRFLLADLEASQGALQYFGLKAETTPSIIIQDTEEHKYLKEGLDAEELISFLKGYFDGTLPQYKKSQPIPEKNDEPVKVVVANSLQEMVFESGKNVLLEFYAPWCGHCKKLAPTLEEVAIYFQNDSDVVIAKLDATENDIPTKVFDIKGYPTLYMISASGKMEQYDGERTKEDIIDFINKHRLHRDASSQTEAKKDEL
eukprot:TRINITY_DN3464_c0_g2_i1.p1 TRINITY_DN3464_c0_g2~~TRINITY_DN3464_c0_g2_i1.p1  ORF type:complete len:525 (-),score=113.95 TRINITY_DN3464_c0_g2_i1:221-1729(-)